MVVTIFFVEERRRKLYMRRRKLMTEANRLDLATELQIILLVVMVAVVFFELWLLRRRRKTRYASKRYVTNYNSSPVSNSNDDFDEAFNAITSTEKISAILKAQGVDTGEADMALGEAKRAHSRGDNTYAIAKANTARVTLMSAKKYTISTKTSLKPAQDLISAPVPEMEDDESGYGPVSQTPEEIPKESMPKLPDNYLQSKFMLTTAEDSIKAAEGCDKDVSVAWRTLAQARSAFDRAEYGKALSHALKAKKQAEGLPTSPIAEEGGPAVTDVGAPMPEEVERWKDENPPVPKQPDAGELSCPKCNNHVSPDDAFCRKCGGKLEFRRLCPGCGIELETGDAFCRKCGTKLTH
jgi:hypothetical protein